MNLITVHKPAEVEECQRRFEQNLKVGARDIGTCTITFRPDTRDEEVYWLRGRKVWASFAEGENRYWNPFGTEDPSKGKNLGITIEINSPFDGIDRRIGGAFAKDPVSGRTYVIHRGVMGGGKAGIGKTSFFGEYQEGKIATLDEGKGESTVALIGELGSRGFPESVTAFVKEVERVKNVLMAPPTQPLIGAPPAPRFTPEFEGLRKYETHSIIKARTNHGRVVRNLREKLIKWGTTSNIPTADGNKPDIHFINNDRRRGDVLFEVKTDTSPSSVYGAIGQLMYYAQLYDPKPGTLVAVFPDDLEEQRRRRLRAIGIKVVTYILSQDVVTFHGIDKII